MEHLGPLNPHRQPLCWYLVSIKRMFLFLTWYIRLTGFLLFAPVPSGTLLKGLKEWWGDVQGKEAEGECEDVRFGGGSGEGRRNPWQIIFFFPPSCSSSCLKSPIHQSHFTLWPYLDGEAFLEFNREHFAVVPGYFHVIYVTWSPFPFKLYQNMSANTPQNTCICIFLQSLSHCGAPLDFYLFGRR